MERGHLASVFEKNQLLVRLHPQGGCPTAPHSAPGQVKPALETAETSLW
jgi:hypothetical protein